MKQPTLKEFAAHLKAGKSPKQIAEMFKLQLEVAEAEAAIRQAQARTQITAIARDLLPQGAAFARKGRPRLLAVLAKIIADPKLKRPQQK